MTDDIKRPSIPVSSSPVIRKPEMPVTYDFMHAMEQVLMGNMVTREEWADKQEYGLLKDEWLMIHHANDPKFYIWKVSKGDMDATDWIVIQPNN